MKKSVKLFSTIFMVMAIVCMLSTFCFATKVGTVTGVYLMWYSLGRFFIESLRTDSLMFGTFKIAQIVSIVLFLIGLLIIILSRKKSKLEGLYNEKEETNIKF